MTVFLVEELTEDIVNTLIECSLVGSAEYPKNNPTSDDERHHKAVIRAAGLVWGTRNNTCELDIPSDIHDWWLMSSWRELAAYMLSEIDKRGMKPCRSSKSETSTGLL